MNVNEIDNIAYESLLYDFYGALLTEKQKTIMELYHEENYSIVEIAFELNVSKQAVYDSLKKSDGILRSYESKLGLMRSFMKTREVISSVDERIADLTSSVDNYSAGELCQELEKIRTLIRKLDE